MVPIETAALPGASRPLAATSSSIHDRASASSAGGDGERHHHLDVGVPAGVAVEAHGRQQGPDLHGVQARLQHGEADPPGADHRVRLRPRAGGCEQPLLLVVEVARRRLDLQVVQGGEELVQRGVEEPHRHGQAVHHLEDREEVGLLDGAELLQGCQLLLRTGGQDHRPDHRGAGPR
jgi:hypothetical protein